MRTAGKAKARGPRGTPFFPVILRMPPHMVEHLDRAADAAWRSRTAEILKRLEESMQGESINEHGVIVHQTQPARNGVSEQPAGGQP